jgi:uncharacterized membrane protein (DUF2068 family)
VNKSAPRSRAARVAGRLDGDRIVAIYQLLKALLLLASGYGVYRLLDARLAARVAHWSGTLTDQRERRLLQEGMHWFGGLGARAVHGFLWITLLYAALAVLEGLGLWWHRRWAEWLTVIASSLLIPFEVAQLLSHPRHNTGWVLAVLFINVIIVVYLGTRLRHR